MEACPRLKGFFFITQSYGCAKGAIPRSYECEGGAVPTAYGCEVVPLSEVHVNLRHYRFYLRMVRDRQKLSRGGDVVTL